MKRRQELPTANSGKAEIPVRLQLRSILKTPGTVVPGIGNEHSRLTRTLIPDRWNRALLLLD